MAGRILVIDDNPDIARDFAQLLGGAGAGHAVLDELEASLFGESGVPLALPAKSFEVDSALQGSDGLSRVEQALFENRPYSVAVVDMRMPPGWNGVETSRRILEADPRLRIVICSAYAEESQTEVTNALGADAAVRFLPKPFDPNVARKLLSELQHEWEAADGSRCA